MPRTITNESNLPAPVYRALSHDSYVGGGDISATRIIAPPRIVALRKFHESEIVEDAADRIWSLLGRAGHKVLEESIDREKKEEGEVRLAMKFEGITKPGEKKPWVWEVTGQPDLYIKPALYDYKYTSVWSVLFGDKPEWERQVNIQAMLHRHKGDEVTEGYIIAFLRDWQTRKARFEKDYPPVGAKTISIPMWTQEEAIAYTLKRVKIHQTAQHAYEASNFDPETLPLCTPEERWYRGHVFAVKFMEDKPGGKTNKNAKRKFAHLTDAKQFMADNMNALPKGKKWAPVEERPGENIRCLDYCEVWKFCPFGKSLREALQPPQQEEDAGD